MPDYNLGRAHGEIEITYDGRGARQAQADMAATSAEAAALDASMGRVNRTFDENRRQTLSSAEAIVQARGEVEELRRAYQRQQEEYERGQQRANDAAERARDILRDQRDDLDALRDARIALDRAEEDSERLRVRAADAYEAYQSKLIAVRQEVERFNAAHVNAAGGFRNMRNEAEKFGEVLESVTEKLSAVARIIGQAGLFGLFGGAAAGSLFASGASALNFLASAMSVVVDVANAFVGAMALIPAVVNAAALSVGALAISFHGMGEALASIGDPKKFLESIKELSPAAKQVALTVQSFVESFRGARYEMQESLFAPIMADIQPLIRQWLPELMSAGKAISNEWGQAFHQVFEYFKQPETQSAFKTFTTNLVTGFQAARGAIQPFLTAWNTLATVGSGVFERLGTAITTVAEKFNAWIQRTAQSGELLAFMNKALDGFTNMGRIIRDVALGINNIFQIFQTGGKGTLESLADLTAKFRAWTESVSGQERIFSFFSLLKTAADAVRPQLKLLGDALGIVGGTLTRLGIAIQPGLNAFFTAFRDALAGLAPYVIQLAPAINQFLAAFGSTLQQVVASIGPQLPSVFKSLSDAFVQLMQVIPPVAEAFANLISHVTPGEIAVFIALVGALKLLGATLPIIRAGFIALDLVMAANPFTLVVLAVGALTAAAVLLIRNWDQVGDVFKRVWESISNTVSGWWDAAYDWGTRMIDNLGKGIMDAARSGLTAAVDFVAGLFPDSWLTHSPAKRGPLSQVSPNEMGSRLVSNFAAGMGEGSSSVTAAADDIAGRAGAIGGSASGSGFGAGFGSQSFASAGVAGKSGRDFSTGQSGFDQWVSFITRDLTAWNNIFREAFSLVDAISNIVTSTMRVAANLWNGGDNPLTQPGGAFGPPKPIAQQEVPGVPRRPIPGKAPDKYGEDLAAANGLPGQESVPGVPRRGASGNQTAPTQPANPPAQTQGQQPANTGPGRTSGGGGQQVPITVHPDGTISSPDPAWQHLITRESGGRNVHQGITDANGAPGSPNAAQGYFQITPNTWRGAGGLEFAPQPIDATPEQQATIAARIFNNNPNLGGDWGAGREGRESGEALKAGLVATPPTTGPQGNIGTPQGPGFPITDRLSPLHGGKIDPSKFFIHTSESDMNPADLADWMEKQGDRSYNYLIDPNSGAITRAVPAGTAAWAVGSPGNQQSINAVVAGSHADWTKEQWLQHPEALQSLAWLTARDAAQFNIPLQQLGPGSTSGIGGHEWVSKNLGGTDHTDPGPGFPWQEFMVMVHQAAAGPGPTAGAPGAPNIGGNTAPGGSQDSGAATAAVAGVTGLAGAALLAKAIQKRSAKRKLALGEILDAEEARLAMEPETPAETRAIAEAPPERVPPTVKAQSPMDVNPTAEIPNQQNRVFQVDPNGVATETTRGAAAAPAPPKEGSIAPADTRAPRATPTQIDPATVRGPGGARLSPAGARALAVGGTALNVLMTLPWAWDQSNAIVRYDKAKTAREQGETPTFDESDFGRNILGPGGGVDTGTVERPMTPEELAKYGNKPKEGEGVPQRPSGPAPAGQTWDYTAGKWVPAPGFPSTPVAPTPVGPESTQKPAPTGPGYKPKAGDSSWMNVPNGWDLSQPIPKDVIAKNMPGLSKEQLDSLPPMYYNAQPGTVSNVAVPDDYSGPYQVSPGRTISVPTQTGTPTPGFPETNDQRSPMEKFTTGMQAVGSVVGDAFTVFQDVIASIGAAANITDTLVRGFENTETVVNFIQQFQTFIKTGADIAKLVGDTAGAIGSMIPSAGGADFGGTEGAKAALGAVSAVASIVQSALEATNAAISLGIEVYHEVGKYAGFLFGGFLGGPNTGPLGGNVRMLLNTRTNQLQTYSEDNPGNKNTFNVPMWQRSYDQQAPAPSLPPQVNIYTGPGQTPAQMMYESMWAISTGAAPVASVAGQD